MSNNGSANTGKKLFVNGVEDADSNYAVVNNAHYSCCFSYKTHTVTDSQTILGKGALNLDFAHDVGCMFYVTWDRKLCDANMQSLSIDPYQFLIPAGLGG